MNNPNQLPPRASFASALAQKPEKPVASAVVPAAAAATTASIPAQTPGSPVNRPTPSATNNQTSPVVKLPNNQATRSSADNSTQNSPAPVSLKAPIKFGSFAAAAAGLVETKPTTSKINITSSSLPPRTHSAPPVVIEPAVIINAPIPSLPPMQSEITENVVSVAAPIESEPSSTVLSSIEEDILLHQQQQQQQQEASTNYVPSQHQHQQQHHYQQQPNFYYQNAPQYHQQQHYAPRPYYNHGGYNNNRAPQQHYQQSEGGYRQQQSYRPRPHYNQGRFYPNQPHQQHGNNNKNYYAPQPQHHQGYYQQPHQQHFQRSAPVMNTFVGPVVPPTIPSDMPAFTTIPAANPSEVAPISVPVVAAASAPAIPVVKPAASKIKIVDPNTGKELNFGASKSIEVPEKASETKEAIPAVVVSAPEPVSVSVPVASAVAPTVPSTPAKKISIVIKDPSSNRELDLNQVVSRPVDLALEELAAAFDQSIKLESGEEGENKVSAPVTPSPGPFEHNKDILATLHVEDDDFNSEDDDDDGEEEEEEEDYSDFSEEEECVFIPSTIQFNQSISYAEGLIPFTAPVDASGVWLYSRDFMLQFREKCTTTPGDLQERLSAAVQKAQAFAKSDRMLAADRPHRRKEGGRGGRDRRDGGEDRRKRSGGHPGSGLLGPQAHLLDPNAVLKNRADNAWAPVKSVEDLSETERILREVKGLLNKLTLEKFHVISDKIISIGIMSSNVLSGVIDCVFDKSVDEPRFAPMYAELCYKIVVEEINGLKKANPENPNPDSQFRRLLVERCQAEYKHKRAWSKKRLEKLLETAADEKKEEVEEGVPCSTVEESEGVKAVKVVGELTDEDYLLIKLKRRVLGNMRFIGEIFKVGLIGEKIMHSIITELLSNVENPEEEEIECLCRLLTTVGAILDKPEAANFWSQYIGRMNWLTAQPGKLSSRVKFMVLDVLELREKRWKTGKVEEGPKTISQIQKEQERKERDQRDRDQRERDRERDQHYRERDRERDRQRPSASAVKFTTSKSSGSSNKGKNDDWNLSGPSNSKSSGQLSRGPSFSAASSNSRRPTTPQSQTTTPDVVIGRFGVLGEEAEEVEKEKEQNVSEAPAAAAVEAVEVDEKELVKKVISLLDELVQMNNYEDVLDELKQIRGFSARASALSGLLNRAIESGKKPSLLAVVIVFTESLGKGVVDEKVIFEALKVSFGMIDDLAVDVPTVFEIAGQLYAALQLSFSHILETLSGCSDDGAKAKVAIHTINAASSDSEYKQKLSQDAKDFLQSNLTPSIQSLMTRLQIQI